MDWVTSDYHFNHENIIKYCNRPFVSSKEMDEWLIANTNKHVAPSDRMFCLGDWIFPGKENFAYAAKRYRDRINCKNIIFIYGNHDKKGRRNNEFMKLFNGCYDLLDDFLGNQKTIFCHYALRVWDKSHRGVWQLYGHSHYSLPDDPNSMSMDVGVDAAAHYFAKDSDIFGKPVLLPENYRPMSSIEIGNLMSKKKWKPVDHHIDINSMEKLAKDI